MNAILQIGIYCVLIFLITKPMGIYLHKVFEGERTWLTPVLKPIERTFYRVAGVNDSQEMRWTTYTVAMLVFSAVSMLMTYIVLRFQSGLPFNPQDLGNIEPRLAFNTAASFTTNTNWQSYVPEVTMSYFSNMFGLATHNYFSAAVGISIAIALVRGLSRHSARELGNFWVDLTRCTLYVLMPICIVITMILVWRGVPQNLNDYTSVTTIAGGAQTIAQGPIASQEAIKMLGTNGGGFLNANSAHPFENPTPFTNFLQMLLIFSIPAGLTYTFGRMVGNTKQGWAIFAAMSVLFLAGVTIATVAEQNGNPLLTTAGASQATSVDGQSAPGGNMEGKESRFGITDSTLFATITTDASCGAVNAMHDSFTAIGGLVPLANIALGEVIFGGVGAGLYGILIYAIVAIFITGLMVGRTPEYLGKKIEPYEIKMAMLTLLVLPLAILGFSSVASVTDWGLTTVWNPGPHGLSEIVYAYTSAAGNNGSAFAGIGANTPWYNVTLGITMLVGRFLMIIPILALAGSLVKKKRAAPTAGVFPTTGPLWVGTLVGVILIVVALTYFPVFSLGGLIEHLHMSNGVTF
jgi:potassium-transporting ATPase potassium-binding subunit